MHSFVYDNISTVLYDVYVFSDRVADAPKRDLNIVSVPGRNGSLTYDNGRYEDIEVTYGCAIMHDYDTQFPLFREQVMSRVGYRRLEDTFNPTEFRLGYVSAMLKPKNVPSFADGIFEIKFRCKPQRFLKSGEVAIIISSNFAVQNPTKYTALPLLRVYGYGTINIGEYYVAVQENDYDYVDIDCDLQNAYFEAVNANNIISLASNGFPKLHEGSNSITIPNTVTRLEIIPRWWTL